MCLIHPQKIEFKRKLQIQMSLYAEGGYLKDLKNNED